MFYGVHDDDVCDLLLSRLEVAMVKNLCPQRWLDQQPGDGEKPIPPEVARKGACASEGGCCSCCFILHVPSLLRAMLQSTTY